MPPGVLPRQHGHHREQVEHRAAGVQVQGQPRLLEVERIRQAVEQEDLLGLTNAGLRRLEAAA